MTGTIASLDEDAFAALSERHRRELNSHATGCSPRVLARRPVPSYYAERPRDATSPIETSYILPVHA